MAYAEASEFMTLIKLAKYKYTLKELKDLRTELTRDEFNKVMDSKAVWHHGQNGEETPAVWKAIDAKNSCLKNPKVKFLYITDTHRAFATSKTVEGAINKYHKVIKGTA